MHIDGKPISPAEEMITPETIVPRIGEGIHFDDAIYDVHKILHEKKLELILIFVKDAPQ